MKWKVRTTENTYSGYKKWFAWYPVKINGYWVWCEHIEKLKYYIHPTNFVNGKWLKEYKELIK